MFIAFWTLPASRAHRMTAYSLASFLVLTTQSAIVGFRAESDIPSRLCQGVSVNNTKLTRSGEIYARFRHFRQFSIDGLRYSLQ